MDEQWEHASAIKQVDDHTYTANIPNEWCVGTVPNGGFITSCILRAIRCHFDTTLKAQKQPDTITLHLEFLRRTQNGPATFKIQEKKMGRQASVVAVTLYQDGREEVTGYASNSNFSTEIGLSFRTSWKLSPAPAPVDFARLARDDDPNWSLQRNLPYETFRNSSSRVKWHFPRGGQPSLSVADVWLSFATGNRIKQDALGFIIDTFPLVIETFLHTEIAKSIAEGELEKQARKNHNPGSFWYPTLLLNIDFVKSLPTEGSDFVFVRAESKRIVNGRYDIEVVIMNEQMELIALSHHVALAVDASKNLAERRTKGANL